MSVRAKFRVTSVEKHEYGAENVKMIPVYTDNDPESENHKFWMATPAGHIEMQINNPEAHGTFEPGQEFYIDFTPAEAAKLASASA